MLSKLFCLKVKKANVRFLFKNAICICKHCNINQPKSYSYEDEKLFHGIQHKAGKKYHYESQADNLLHDTKITNLS